MKEIITYTDYDPSLHDINQFGNHLICDKTTPLAAASLHQSPVNSKAELWHFDGEEITLSNIGSESIGAIGSAFIHCANVFFPNLKTLRIKNIDAFDIETFCSVAICPQSTRTLMMYMLDWLAVEFLINFCQGSHVSEIILHQVSLSNNALAIAEGIQNNTAIEVVCLSEPRANETTQVLELIKSLHNKTVRLIEPTALLKDEIRKLQAEFESKNVIVTLNGFRLKAHCGKRKRFYGDVSGDEELHKRVAREEESTSPQEQAAPQSPQPVGYHQIKQILSSPERPAQTSEEAPQSRHRKRKAVTQATGEHKRRKMKEDEPGQPNQVATSTEIDTIKAVVSSADEQSQTTGPESHRHRIAI